MINKLIFSHFSIVRVLFSLKRDQYKIFKVIAEGKHFYRWQWNLLDKWFK
jgi:hypothetical protein